MKYLFLSIFCLLLAGCCSKEGAVCPPELSFQGSAEEFTERDNPAEWSEKDLHAQIKMAKKSPDPRWSRWVADYYLINKDLEQTQCWYQITLKKLRALPPEDELRKAIPKIEAMSKELDEYGRLLVETSGKTKL